MWSCFWFGYFAHAYSPPPLGGSYAGEVHFNDAYNWTMDFSGYCLIHTAMHEIGHALGLMHSDRPSAIIYHSYQASTTFSYDDGMGIWSLYGRPAINGPTSVRTNQTFTYSLSPVLLSSVNYSWRVTPSGATIFDQGNGFAGVYFNQNQRYVITCTITTSCSEYTVSNSVNVIGGYSVSTNSSRQVIITSENGIGRKTHTATMCNYQLCDLLSGKLIVSGKLNLTGDVVNFSSIPSGHYIFKIEINPDEVDTHKITF